MANTYELISSNVLSSAAASVTFSAIPATYTDLVVRLTCRSDRTGVTNDYLSYTLNGVSTGYSETQLYAGGTSVGTWGYSSATFLLANNMASAGNTSNTFSTYEIYIPNYAGSTQKPMSVYGVTENNTASDNYMEIDAMLANITSAITSITLDTYPTYGTNFVSGSSFYLYGIKKN
jgi:hypothetical protein